MLGVETSKTMGALVVGNNWAKVLVKLTNFNVFVSPLMSSRATIIASLGDKFRAHEHPASTVDGGQADHSAGSRCISYRR
jgi:hypothetical protein